MKEELHVRLHSMFKLFKVYGMAVIFVTVCHNFLRNHQQILLFLHLFLVKILLPGSINCNNFW